MHPESSRRSDTCVCEVIRCPAYDTASNTRYKKIDQTLTHNTHTTIDCLPTFPNACTKRPSNIRRGDDNTNAWNRELHLLLAAQPSCAVSSYGSPCCHLDATACCGYSCQTSSSTACTAIWLRGTANANVASCTACHKDHCVFRHGRTFP